MTGSREAPPTGPLASFARTADFWARSLAIYAGYKACQAQALALRALGWSEERLKSEHWARQHSQAAEQMYSLCVGLRGFYLKVRKTLVPCPQRQRLHSSLSAPPRGCQLQWACLWPAHVQVRGSYVLSQLSAPSGAPSQPDACPCRRSRRRRRGSSWERGATLCPSRSAASCRCCTTRCMLHACPPGCQPRPGRQFPVQACLGSVHSRAACVQRCADGVTCTLLQL